MDENPNPMLVDITELIQTLADIRSRGYNMLYFGHVKTNGKDWPTFELLRPGLVFEDKPGTIGARVPFFTLLDKDTKEEDVLKAYTNEA